MAPKKSKTDKQTNPNNNNTTVTAGAHKTHETGLISAPFEEGAWRCCVSLLVGGSPEEEEFIGALQLALQEPKRKLFTLLSWDSTVAKIHDLGNPKTKKSKDAPKYCEVTEPAKLLLDAGEVIPCDLMAKILKFQLLQIKASDQGRRAAEQASEGKAKDKVAPASASKNKGANKAKKAKASDAAPVEKESKLKRRGEDVQPPNYIDDEPDDGAHHYILLTGFHQPQLVSALDAVGVHVANVIKVEGACAEVEESTCTPGEGHQIQRHAAFMNEDGKQEMFWGALGSVLESGPPLSKLQDVARLSYTVTDCPLPLDSQDPQALLELGSRIFEGVASLIYDCLDWRRQHQHYRDSVRLINVPTVVTSEQCPVTPAEEDPQEVPSQESEPAPLSRDVDMCYYSNLLAQVPSESCSVALILHCMLEQVVVSTDQLSSDNEDSVMIDHRLAKCMLGSFLDVAHTEQEKEKMMGSPLALALGLQDRRKLTEDFRIEETQPGSEYQPLVFRHHDERALRLRHVKVDQGFDPVSAEITMMQSSPAWRPIRSAVLLGNTDAYRMAYKQQMLHNCSTLEAPWSTVEHMIHHNVLESMPITSLDQKGALLKPPHQPSPFPVPWNDPLAYDQTFLHQEGENREGDRSVFGLIDVSDIQRSRQRCFSDYHHAEKHSSHVFPQVLQSAMEAYICMDTFHSSLDNTLYVICHNPMSPQRQCQESWDSALHTDVAFRNYLEHVVDTISDWMRQEKAKREAELSLSRMKSPEEGDAAEEALPEPVIRKESLKAQKLEQDQRQEAEMTKRSKGSGGGGKRGKDQRGPSGKDSRDEKKPEATGSPTVSVSTTAPPLGVDGELQATKQLNGFLGYNMGGKLVHISGRRQYFFPSDGGQITVENISFVQGSSLMKVALKKDGHHFYTHVNCAVVESVKTSLPVQDPAKEVYTGERSLDSKIVQQGSFSVVLDNGLHLSYSYYGPAGEYTVCGQVPDGASLESQEVSQHTSPSPVPSAHHCTQIPGQDTAPSSTTQSPGPATPTKSCEQSTPGPFHMSLPNGLLLQFLVDNGNAVPPVEPSMLVRQSFPLHGDGVVGTPPDAQLSRELSRVVTSLGTVIRHMRDGSTEVLFADGTVSSSSDSGPVWVPDSKLKDKVKNSQKDAEPDKGCWITTAPSGARISTVGNTHQLIPKAPILLFHATDPTTQAVVVTRQDSVVSVQETDGTVTVEHADGTRMTSLYQERTVGCSDPRLRLARLTNRCARSTCKGSHCPPLRDPGVLEKNATWEEEKGPDANSGYHGDPQGEVDAEETPEEREGTAETSTQAKERVLLVEREGCATVVMYPERGTAHVFLADGTIATATCRGVYQVFPSSTGLLHIGEDGTCLYTPDSAPSPEEGSPGRQPGRYVFSHTDRVTCDITDPAGNHFQVMQDGHVSTEISSPARRPLERDEEEEEFTDEAEKARLFLVHGDGSGTELLSSQTVEELLYQAYTDPAVALLKEPDTQGEFDITILRPSRPSVWSQWLLEKQKLDIRPADLQNRSWQDFPRVERKTPGPAFGSALGRGLSLSDRRLSGQCQPLLSSPQALEVRELKEYQPISQQLRDVLHPQLKEYMEGLLQREQRSEEMKVKEPRSEEERVHASDLLKLVVSPPEDEDPGQASDTRTAGDIATLYNKTIVAPCLQSDVSGETSDRERDKEERWTGRITQHRQELNEDRAQREALRSRRVVPYFHSENADLHQGLDLLKYFLCHLEPVMQTLSMDLPAFPKTFLMEAVQDRNKQPLNPTPTQAPSPAAGSDATTAQNAGYSSLRGPTSVQQNVSSSLRKTKVNIPNSVLSNKPCSIPNQQVLSLPPIGPHSGTRGFQLCPSSVDFGTLREGGSYVITVVMTNVGVDTCRFSVKQPPPTTGLRVIYNPGPVAAGFQVQLDVQLFPMCAGGEAKNYISQYITINTETEIIHLCVKATILPEKLYDLWLKDQKRTKKSRTPPVRHRTPPSALNRELTNHSAGPGETPAYKPDC